MNIGCLSRECPGKIKLNVMNGCRCFSKLMIKMNSHYHEQ